MRVTGLLLAGILLALAAGCARTAAAPGRTEIRYCFFGGFEDWKMWRTIAAEFERANPDVAVRLLYWPGSNYQAKMQLTMAAGTAPDVMDVEDEPFAAYCKMRQFEDLGPYLRRVASQYALSGSSPRRWRRSG